MRVIGVNNVWYFVLLNNCVGCVLPKRGASGSRPLTVCVL